jgi:hypothetical protein
MTKKKLLLITFDYELFLGERSGSVMDCLVMPTLTILRCLKKHDFKAYFFVDTVYLLRLKEMAKENVLAKDDLDLITSQLIQIIKNGHEIYPHIHPHWMDAVYDPATNEWCLNQKRYYTFASVNEEQQTYLFEQSVDIIRSILALTNRSQHLDAYRAGGWSIQPFNNFRPKFLRYGIKHEFSVVPGKYHFSDAQSFDFRAAPVKEPVYRFDEDACREDVNGPFTEWTISSITMNRYERWIDFKIGGLLRRLGKKPPYKGKGVASIIKREGDNQTDKHKKRVIASFEGLNPFTLHKYLSAISRSDYYHFISHPKLLNPYECAMMDDLFRILRRKYDVQTDFRKTLG